MYEINTIVMDFFFFFFDFISFGKQQDVQERSWPIVFGKTDIQLELWNLTSSDSPVSCTILKCISNAQIFVQATVIA